MFANTIRYLDRSRRSLTKPDHLKKIGQIYKQALVAEAGLHQLHGHMARAMRNARVTVEGRAGKWTVTITNRARLGSPSDKAPKGTIAAFLKDYPRYRSAGDPPHSSWAWRALPPQGKIKLEQERLRGKYGGANAIAAGRAPYFWAQDQGTAEGAASGKKAGLRWSRAKGFVGRAKARARAEVMQYVREVIQRAVE
jgi:hypothetical protein